MFVASFKAGESLPTLGALPPTCDVVKNCGSISAKSFSSIMRCINTEPTMPRHPTKPTLSIFLTLTSLMQRPLRHPLRYNPPAYNHRSQYRQFYNPELAPF